MLFKDQLFLIAGPCVMESYSMLEEICAEMQVICQEYSIAYIFKASFDKANRTSIDSFRGPGIQKGLQWLEKIKRQFKVKVLTDVHSPQMIQEVGEVVDCLQIPAFLARQTDLYIEVAKTGKPLNVKKGQFMAPEEMKNVIKKFTDSGGKEIAITERGTFFGYGNLVVDFRSIQKIQEMQVPYIYDATHSLQQPAFLGNSSGGQREFFSSLLKAQIAGGANGLFIETHPNPLVAKSDKATQIPLNHMKDLMKKAKLLYNFVHSL